MYSEEKMKKNKNGIHAATGLSDRLQDTVDDMTVPFNVIPRTAETLYITDYANTKEGTRREGALMDEVETADLRPNIELETQLSKECS